MRRSFGAGSLGNWIRYDGIPVTKSLILASVCTLVLVGLFRFSALGYLLAFSTAGALMHPWTALTYPLISTDLPSLLFSCFWLWVAGGALERSWGSAAFGALFFAVSAISALGLLVGWFLTGIGSVVYGLWLPLAGITVAFAMQNPEDQVLFMFVIPLRMKFLAVIDVAFVLFSYGRSHILLGLLALSGCALAYWYAVYGRSIRPRSVRRDDPNIIRIHDRLPRAPGRNLSPMKWLREYRQRKRLRDLFHRSGYKDD